MAHASNSATKKAAMRAAPEEDPEFQIAPMIDILLVLLVFFMSISSTEVLQTNEAVKLPVAKDSKPKEKNSLAAVAVSRSMRKSSASRARSFRTSPTR